MLEAQGIAPSDPSPMDSTANTGRVSRKQKANFTEEEEEKPIVEIKDEDEDKRIEALTVSHLCKIPVCGQSLTQGTAQAKPKQARLERKQTKHAAKKVKHESQT